jgi:hypothetical protein
MLRWKLWSGVLSVLATLEEELCAGILSWGGTKLYAGDACEGKPEPVCKLLEALRSCGLPGNGLCAGDAWPMLGGLWE